LSYLVNTQTNKQTNRQKNKVWQKHNLLGGGNKLSYFKQQVQRMSGVI